MMQNLLVRTVISYLIIFGTPLLLPVMFIKLVGLGGLRDLVTYEARDTPLHKLDPRLKVLYPIAMGILSILLNWDYMLIVFGLSILPWFWLHPSRAKVRVLTVMVIGPALTGFWSQGLYYLPTRQSTTSTSSPARSAGWAHPASPPTAWCSALSRPPAYWSRCRPRC
jgi:energy-coupling factor transport system permease protein